MLLVYVAAGIYSILGLKQKKTKDHGQQIAKAAYLSNSSGKLTKPTTDNRQMTTDSEANGQRKWK